MTLVGKHILRTSQLDRETIDQLFAVADLLLPVAKRRETVNVLHGAVLANLFFEPSTRSRLSFGAAFARLGGAVLDTAGVQSTSIAKGESLRDTGRVVSGYADVIVVRYPVAGAVDEIAAATSIPVINAGDGAGEHPTQALVDVYTMRNELRQSGSELDGLRIAMIGDLKHGRTVHSLLQLIPLFKGAEVTLVSDDTLRMPNELVELARSAGTQIRETSSLKDGIGTADIVYLTRVQEERFATPELYAESRGKYRLTRRLFEELCPPHAIIMHPLPRDSRGESNELDIDLNGHPRVAIFRQTDSGIPIRMALFAMVLGVDGQITSALAPARWYTPPSFDKRDERDLG